MTNAHSSSIDAPLPRLPRSIWTLISAALVVIGAFFISEAAETPPVVEPNQMTAAKATVFKDRIIEQEMAARSEIAVDQMRLTRLARAILIKDLIESG